MWQQALVNYHDRQWLLPGLLEGYDIGLRENVPQVTYTANPTLPTDKWMDIAITNWVIKCANKGFLLGPFTADNCPFDRLFFSPLFAVPKPDLSWRIINHLSYPKFGVSVNDLLSDEAKHVQYIRFTEVCSFVYKLGKGAKLWVVDAKDAYYRVPIKRQYWQYMGIKWYGYIFVFTSLQMGLASACQIYTRFADAVLYIIINNAIDIFYDDLGNQLVFHYLDDFFGGHDDPSIAQNQFDKAFGWFEKLGIPTQPNKCNKPNTLQKILGWLYDTCAQTVSIPPNKVEAYIAILRRVIRNKLSDKKQLEQIVGFLTWASVAVFPGKAFVRRLEHALYLELKDYKTKIHLTEFVLEDMRWWVHALQHMNGIPLQWIVSNNEKFDIEVWTDAATKSGLGGCSSDKRAFQIRNSDTFSNFVSTRRKGVDIHFLELLAMLVAAKLWAPFWKHKNVRFYCDNPGAAASLIHKRAPLHRQDMNWMVREFSKLAVIHQFRFWIVHVDGSENEIADGLSRFKSEYKNDSPITQSYEFETHVELKNLVNQLYSDILKLPYNDDDPKRLQ